MKNKEKVKTGLILTACLIACFVLQYFSAYAFDFIILFLTYVATKEFSKLQLKSGMPAYDYCPEVATLLVFVSSFVGFLCGLNASVIMLIVICVVAVFYVVMFVGSFLVFKKDLENDPFRLSTNMSVKRFAFFKANNTLVCVLYPTLLMFFIYLINHISTLGLVNFSKNTASAPMGLFGLILLFAVCCLTDTFAMLFGNLIGGIKIFPKISPKKTLSGCLFGLLGGVIGAMLTLVAFKSIFSYVFANAHYWQFLIVGLLGSVVAQSGDLFESFAKRRANVKDAGEFFKSHGGVLDRIDSVIFVAPFVFICLLFIFG